MGVDPGDQDTILPKCQKKCIKKIKTGPCGTQVKLPRSVNVVAPEVKKILSLVSTTESDVSFRFVKLTPCQ